MNFQENESVSMVRQTVRDFAEKHIRPDMMEWDESQTFPVDVLIKSAPASIDNHEANLILS